MARPRDQTCHKWIVFGAAVSVAFFDYGLPCTFGALYIGMLNTFNAGRAKTAFVQSLNTAFCFGFGIVSGFFISRWGVKTVSFIGAALTVVGFLMSFFATSIYYLYGFISVISGIGFNALYVSAVMCVGWTFTGKLKPMVLSVQSVGTAISGFVWPNVLNASLHSYGLRGTYLIIAGIFLHNIPFAIIFANSKAVEQDDVIDISTDDPCGDSYSEHVYFMPQVEDSKDTHQHITDTDKLETWNILEIENHKTDITDDPTNKAGHKASSEGCFSPDMFLYVTYTLATVIQMSTLVGFVTLYQDINVSSGLTIDQSDRVYMSYSLCNILGRFSPIIPAKIQCINSFVVPVVASLCGVVGQLTYLTVSPSLTSVIIAMGFTGLSDGGCISPMQSIMFEILPVEKQAVGFGFVLTAMGIACALTGPIFGSLRDNTASYQTVLMTTTMMFLISAVLQSACLLKSSRNSKNCEK